jgi:hypothetical protein
MFTVFNKMTISPDLRTEIAKGISRPKRLIRLSISRPVPPNADEAYLRRTGREFVDNLINILPSPSDTTITGWQAARTSKTRQNMIIKMSYFTAAKILLETARARSDGAVLEGARAIKLTLANN